MNVDKDTDIHSCSYYCMNPACVLAQRNELRNKLETLSKRRMAQQIAGLEEEVALLKARLCRQENAQ